VTQSEEASSQVLLKMPASMEELDNRKRIKPGHLVSIQILEDKRDPVQQIVAITGEVQAPYLGLTKADGLTCHELARQIKTGLEKTFLKEATVLVSCELYSLENDPCLVKEISFAVANGKVAKTGKYALPENKDLAVSGFLELAGGYISSRNIPKIVIVRRTPQGNKRILVNSQAVLIKKRSEYDLVLRHGDVVIVE
jgi:polysaccharide export outer membrane protein